MRYTGTVRDANSGHPIHGARVQVVMDGKEIGAFPTDEHGQFYQEEKNQSVGRFLTYSVSKHGYRPHTVENYPVNGPHVDLSTLELVPVMDPPNYPEPQEPISTNPKVSVRVLDEQQRPVSGANVEVFNYSRTNYSLHLQSGTTNSNGDFSFDDDDVADNDSLGVVVKKRNYYDEFDQKVVADNRAKFEVTLRKFGVTSDGFLKWLGEKVKTYGPATAALLLIGSLVYCYTTLLGKIKDWW